MKNKLFACILYLFMVVVCVVGFSSCDKCDHKWSEWTIKTEATCLEAGTQERVCSECDEVETSSVEALGHDWKDATCTSPKTCERCNATEGDVVHSYTLETVKDEALKSAATCQAAAVYYKSCECGAVSTNEADVFTSGDVMPHSYTLETVKDEALKSAATETNAAVYYKSCVCGAISTSDADTFTYGGPIGHVHSFTLETVKDQALKSAANCQAAAVYYKSCECGVVSTSEADVFTSGDVAPHSYTVQTVKDEALKSAADCKNAAVYYKSCECGLISTNAADTFTSGSPKAHSYTLKTVKDAALKSAADCKNAAVYYKSCECGAISTSSADTFTNGSPKAHSYTLETVKDEALKSAADCENLAVYYKSCECGAISTNVADTFTSGSIGDHNFVEGVCSVCGEEEIVCDHTELHDATLDLGELGFCGGVVKYKTCECGEVKMLLEDDMDLSCDFDVESAEESTDENGNPTYTVKTVCGECGLEAHSLQTLLMGEGCEHLLVAEATLIFDGETVIEGLRLDRTYENHKNIEPFAIDLSEYEGACGGVIRTEKCTDCGKILMVNIISADCPVDFDHFDGDPEEVTDDNGVVHYIRELQCTDCDFRVVVDLWYESISTCERNVYYKSSIYYGDELIWEEEDGYYEDVHEYEYSYELVGDTCEDGVNVTAHCDICGTTITDFISHHDDVEIVEMDLSEHTECGGYVCYEICRICGKIAYMNDLSVGCDFEVTDEEEIFDDEDNVIGTKATLACRNCGISVVQENTVEYLEDCRYVEYVSTSIYKGEELIFAWNEEWYGSDHDLEREYELLGDSCEDKIRVKSSCKKCDYEDEWVTEGHVTEYSYMDLGEHGACGGFIECETCVICETVVNYYPVMDCHLSLVSREEILDQHGNLIAVEVVEVCEICGLKVLTHSALEKITECEHTDTTTFNIYFEDELILEAQVVFYGYEHDFEYTYEFDGDTCEDGVTIFGECSRCGETEKRYFMGHDMEYFNVHLDQHGACHGEIYDVARCAICGYVERFSGLKTECRGESTTEDILDSEDNVIGQRVTMVCRECGFTYVEENIETPLGDCRYEYYYAIRIYTAENECLSELEMTSVETQHKYEYTYDLLGDTCDDGVKAVGVCADCGDHNSWSNYGHILDYTYIDLSEHGCCYGELGSEYCVSCGTVIDIRTNINCPFDVIESEMILDDEENIIGEISTAICPVCGLKLVDTTIKEYLGNCQYDYHTNAKVYVGEECIFEGNKVRRQERHDYEYTYELEGESCTDGVNMVYTCGECGDTYETHVTHHLSSGRQEIDLSEYTSCGGTVVYYGCNVCGDISSLSHIDLRCDMEQTEYINSYDDYGRLISEYYRDVCKDCGLVCEYYYKLTHLEECAYGAFETYELYMGDECIFENTDEYGVVLHTAEYTYEMIGATCTEGVRIYSECTVCGEASNWTEYDHVDLEYEVDIDLSEYTSCGGSINVDRCTVCGEIIRMNSDDLNCNMKEEYYENILDEYENVVGFVATDVCTDCGLEYTITRVNTALGDCRFEVDMIYSFWADGECVIEISEKWYYTDHDEFIDYKFQGNSCEEGVICRTYCTVHGALYEEVVYGHIEGYREIYMEDYGACEGYIVVIPCAACGEFLYGEDINISCKFSDEPDETDDFVDGKGFSHHHDIYYCTECGLKMIFDSYEDEYGLAGAEYYYWGEELITPYYK